jgi:hypothetical protein
VLAIDGHLDVISDLGMMTPSDGHRAGIRVGQGDLTGAGLLHLLVDAVQILFPVLQVVNNLPQFLRGLIGETAFLFVVFIEFFKVPVDLLVDLLQAVLELGAGEISVAGVGCLELGPVEGDELAAEQSGALAELDEAAAKVADGLAIGLAEIGDGLEVGRQTFEQPNDLEVAVGLAFEGAAGADSEKVAIEIEAKKIAGVVGRPRASGSTRGNPRSFRSRCDT